MKCPVCNQSSMLKIKITRCVACGFPIEKVEKILVGRKINIETIKKARKFFDKEIKNGAWFELKKMNYYYYLYGRHREGEVKRSQYIGKIL